MIHKSCNNKAPLLYKRSLTDIQFCQEGIIYAAIKDRIQIFNTKIQLVKSACNENSYSIIYSCGVYGSCVFPCKGRRFRSLTGLSAFSLYMPIYFVK